jgi:Na+-transporting NADH:ubiquinone oxidoreductase subunit NqrB
MIKERTSSTPTGPLLERTPGAAPKRQFDSRYVAPLLITTILIAGQFSYGILENLPRTLLAIGCSIAAEIVLSLLVFHKFPHLASAYVSGISCGILIRSPLVWPFAMVALISILSKYVLRWGGRHLWNPSNFGISAMLLLAPAAVASLTQQFGNSIWPMVTVWTLGSVILWRLKRLHICAAYVGAFVLFAALRSLLPGHHDQGLWPAFVSEIAPITGPVYQLFIFFMITDPKSTVQGVRPQMAVAVAVAGAECVLRLLGNVHAPYYALFLVGPTANLIEIGWKKWWATPPTTRANVATA